MTGGDYMECKLSEYNYMLTIENTIYVYNTLCGSILKMDSQAEYDKFLKKYEGVADADDETAAYLIENGFIVPYYVCEKQIVNNMRIKGLSADRSNTYRILPTMECNARCFYCYENNEKDVMDKNTADQLIKYIVDSCDNNKVAVQWFGGEPLLNVEIIDYISNGLKKALENTVKFSMITNGSLINHDIVNKMKHLWNIEYVQITLDGTKEEYEKRKRYIEIQNSFEKVLDNIELILKNNIKVHIRLNYDTINYVDIMNLIDMLSLRYCSYKNVVVYAHPIFGSTKCGQLNHENIDIWNKINKKLIEVGFLEYDKFLDLNLRMIKCSACQDNSFVIVPNGSMYKCTMAINEIEERVGDVWNGITNWKTLKKWCSSDVPSDCDDCKFLPLCQGGCKAGELGYSTERCYMNDSKIEKIIKQKIMKL